MTGYRGTVAHLKTGEGGCGRTGTKRKVDILYAVLTNHRRANAQCNGHSSYRLTPHQFKNSLEQWRLFTAKDMKKNKAKCANDASSVNERLL